MKSKAQNAVRKKITLLYYYTPATPWSYLNMVQETLNMIALALVLLNLT